MEQALYDFACRHPRLLVLSGAGISTASGIPGYRDDAGQWRGKQPIMLQAFLSSAAARQRYWARSLAGWPVLAGAKPNAAHDAVARLQTAGHVARLVTQNVDGLHQRAGSGDVIELHGNIGRVTCLACGHGYSRATVQAMLQAGNPGWTHTSAAPAPDGDAHVETDDFDTFQVPVCSACGGMLKPDVVFFGESVPRQRVDDAMDALARADALLVVGSSLMVYSGYRFCDRASKLGKPIVAVNQGRTRADALLSLKVAQPCETALVELADRLGAGVAADAGGQSR